MPTATIKWENSSNTLAAIVISYWYVLKCEYHFFMDYWVAVPEALGYWEWIDVDIADGGSSWLLNFEDVGLFVALIVFVISSDDHNLLFGDLDCGWGGEWY